MALLKREDILSCVDIATELVSVPEWGGDVMVKAMNGTERDAFEASMVEVRGKQQIMKMDNIRAKLVAKTVVDENGELVFSVGDIEALGRKSSAALDRVFAVSQRLSKLTQADVDDLVKNS
jgi:hypothetical protein